MDTTKTIDTPYNNAVFVINRTNELLTENNIKDSTGTEIAQLEQSAVNPAWLFALACGSLHTSWQEQISKAYSAIDAQNCEEDQVLVLAGLAGLIRGNGTPSHITVSFFNTASERVSIPIGSVFSEAYTNHKWSNNTEINLASASESGHSQITTLYSVDDGAFEVPKDISFTSSGYPLIEIKSASESTPGESIESIASLRNRLSQGDETSDFLSQCKTAIERLSGIESCSIWFNGGITSPLIIGDPSGSYVSVPPREAYVSVKGVDVSHKIAETYFNYLDVPATVGAQTETYQRGMQPLTMHYDIAEGIAVSIYVQIRSADAAVGSKTAIAEIVTAHSGTLECGQNLTSQMVSEWLLGNGYAEVIGCNVGSATGLISNIGPTQYCVFNPETIIVTEV